MIKSKLITTAASLTLVSAALISAEGFARGEKGSKHKFTDESRQTLLERLDTNGDGVLSLDEFSYSNAKKSERHFNKKDTDGDSALSLDEFSTATRHRRHHKLDTLDTDIIKACVTETLGYELSGHPDAATLFTNADINMDEAIDLDEFLLAGDQRAETRFAEIDGDKDGQLSSDEIEDYESIKETERHAHRTCVGEQLQEDSLLN